MILLIFDYLCHSERSEESIWCDIVFYKDIKINSSNSNEVRIVANHYISNIAEIYATLTLPLIMLFAYAKFTEDIINYSFIV